jgi:predicted dehydrogenase
MEPTKRVRVAGIGTGSIFRGAHLPAYPEIAQAQLVALCDPDPQAQQLAKARYDSLMLAKIEQARERKDTATVDRLESDMASLRIVSDISEVIAEIKPDLVDICTQPFLHAPLSIQALDAGINVMCEKPISRSWLETERLLAAIQRSGRLYQHNENWLWDKDYYTAKKLVDAGAIGEPLLMFLATAHGGPEGAGKFWNSDFGGGGALLDNGIHAIGASWYISGLEKKPTMVKAAEPFGMSIRMPNRILDGRFQKVTVDDDAHILIRFEHEESGAWTSAHVEGSWSHRDSPDTAIIGTTGRIFFKNEDDRRYAIVMDSYEREARRIEVSGPTWQPWPSSFYGEILNMVECVRNNVPTITSAQFGAECSAIVGASYLSEKNGREAVHVDEFKSFARGVAERYPNDPAGADNALIDLLLSAVRK